MAHPSKPSSGQTSWDSALNSALDVAYDSGGADKIAKSVGTTKGDVLVYNGTAWTRMPVGTNGQVVTADSAQTLGVKWATPSSGGSGTGGALYNVKSSTYGALGDGSTDDTTAIQAAVTAAGTLRGDGSIGGVVYFPTGTYKITAAITVPVGVSLAGDGQRASIIKQTSTTLNAFAFTAPGETDALAGTGMSISHLFIQGPTVTTSHTTLPGTTGTGSGISFKGNSLVGLAIRDVEVRGFRGTGIYIGGSIVTVLENVRSDTNGVHGIHITGVDAGTATVTSTNIVGGWARNNTSYGLFIDQLSGSIYSAVVGFAADDNAYNYRIKNARGMSFVACGSEFHGDARAKTPETSYYVDGSHNISFLNCVSLGSNSIDFQFVNSSLNFSIDGARVSENSARASKTATVNAASGSTGVIRGLSDVSSVNTLTLNSGVTLITHDATNGYTISNSYLNMGADLRFGTAGKTLRYGTANGSSGGTALIGETTLVGGTKTLTGMTNLATGALIFLSRHTAGGTTGDLSYGGFTAGTGFTITSSSGTDTSSVVYVVVNIG